MGVITPASLYLPTQAQQWFAPHNLDPKNTSAVDQNVNNNKNVSLV